MNRACLPSMSRGLARSCLRPATIVRVWSPKPTRSCTNLSEPGTSCTASILPTRTSIRFRTSIEMLGFTGAMDIPELILPPSPPAGSWRHNLLRTG